MGLGLVDTYLAYKFIKMLATPWKKMEAYKLGIWLLREEAKEMGVENENLIEETFLEWLKDNDSELDDGMNESFGKVNLVVTKGDYILNGEKVTVIENTESFDSILGVPLFRVNDTVCSWYDLEKNYEKV